MQTNRFQWHKAKDESRSHHKDMQMPMNHFQLHEDSSFPEAPSYKIQVNHFRRHLLAAADESCSRSKGTQIKTNRFQWRAPTDESRSRSRDTLQIKINHFQWHVACQHESYSRSKGMWQRNADDESAYSQKQARHV